MAVDGNSFNAKVPCRTCGGEIPVNFTEFADVSQNPSYKEKILNGDLFIVKCPECGDETLVEYPIMYMDSDSKLNIYMVPEHDRGLLENLNSLELPPEVVDAEAIFRLAGSTEALVEKILIFDNGRDDRIIEFYKLIISEQLKEEWPEISASKLLYYVEDDEELFIVWDSNPEPGSEKLTVVLDDELYKKLVSDYGKQFQTEPGKYAEVNGAWILDRVDLVN